MKIGVCTGQENIGAAAEAGFDYVELRLTYLAELSESGFVELAERFDRAGIRCEACNVMLPGGMPLHGADYDEKRVFGYVENVFSRAARLGVRHIVFGSGGARKYADTDTGDAADKGSAGTGVGANANAGAVSSPARKMAWDTLIAFAGRLGDAAAGHGLTVCVEPLNRRECNILNTVAEGLRFVREVNHSSVALLADFYHMRVESEGMAPIVEAGALLRHTHIANSNGRVYPLDANEDSYAGFLGALKQIGYTGGVSIEGATKDFARDAVRSLAVLRGLANA